MRRLFVSSFFAMGRQSSLRTESIGRNLVRKQVDLNSKYFRSDIKILYTVRRASLGSSLSPTLRGLTGHNGPGSLRRDLFPAPSIEPGHEVICSAGPHYSIVRYSAGVCHTASSPARCRLKGTRPCEFTHRILQLSLGCVYIHHLHAS